MTHDTYPEITILREGNARYQAGKYDGNLSEEKRKETVVGQKPYAVILTCSDSRVIPEAIFSAGIGELFVIRVAGNVATDAVLGSVQYAVEHLGTNLVVVLSHTNCGAIGATINGHADKYTKLLTDEIRRAIEKESDPTIATKKNARYVANKINDLLRIDCAVPALYDLSTGSVEFF